ncbi:MAG: 4-(cytidine 5'-diphospho)-2-C-methyl-D-erythritol kinase [Parasphingopyxis sp.]|nr:4-(cytidine 5'-diphospho)-2-C-methyl-D-erythritol kinase [Sphingomonadales bacterium]
MSETPRAVRETAFAKINLALHVRERMADGYHRIETLFAFAEDGDALVCEPANGLTLEIAGPFAAGLPSGSDNLVLQAALALRESSGTREGARLSLEKRLPVAAGIGGGSADAAAALRGLARLWDVSCSPDQLAEIGRALGADVPACLASLSCFGGGRGDRLRPVDGSALRGRPLLLVNPGVPVPTPAVYAGWDGEDRGPLDLGEPPAIDTGWRNDLAAPAIALEGEIGEALDRLKRLPGGDLVNMSGSGATCFALFADSAARDDAASMLRAERPDWWIRASRLR